MAGVGLLAAAAAPSPALAAVITEPGRPQASAAGRYLGGQSAAGIAAACDIWIAAPGSSARVPSEIVTAGDPPEGDTVSATNFFPTRAAATWYIGKTSGGTTYFSGVALQGANLYRHTITLSSTTSTPKATKVGGGWGTFRLIATSNYSVATPRHSYLYALNNNGRLYRYASSGASFRALGSFPGFASFKTMTVISETASYDTLLMTTKTGALYTVRIPTAAAAKPVVKLVRKSGWTAFESLAVYGCGTRGGNLVAGIDHHTDTGYLYAMNKATGLSTGITSYGEIVANFPGLSHITITSSKRQLRGE